MLYQALPARDCRNAAEIRATYRSARQRLVGSGLGVARETAPEPLAESTTPSSRDIIRPAIEASRRDTFSSVLTLLDVEQPKISAQTILQAVASAHGVSVGDLKGPRRWSAFVNARHHAVSLLLRLRPDLSLPLIGKLLNRDHTTIINARNRWPRVAHKFARQKLLVLSTLENPPPVDRAHRTRISCTICG